VATLVHNAWLRTIEDGIHTYDIYKEGISKQKVGTREFADAIIDRLGKQPHVLKAVNYKSAPKMEAIHRSAQVTTQAKKELVGVDVFIDWKEGSAEELASRLQRCNNGLELTMLANRGAKLWPNGLPETFTTDQWRARFKSHGQPVKHLQITALLQHISESGLDFIKTENLYTFDGQVGYSVLSGE
jgi:isocitrate dehydrogenase